MNILKREDPQTILNILNKKQSILVMKQAPKNGEGCWWYLYCDKGNRLVLDIDRTIAIDNEHYAYGDKDLNGKVVARFWCDKVEEIGCKPRELFSNDYYYLGNTAPIIDLRFAVGDTLCNNSCLTQDEIHSYLKGKKGYAIHFNIFEIFYKPKELDEFYRVGFNKALEDAEKEIEELIEQHKPHPISFYSVQKQYEITKAPTNYCYVEGD